MRWAKMRLTTKRRTTPAFVKTLAAMAMLELVGFEAHAMRRTFAVIRAMQKPKRRPERMNL